MAETRLSSFPLADDDSMTTVDYSQEPDYSSSSSFPSSFATNLDATKIDAACGSFRNVSDSGLYLSHRIFCGTSLSVFVVGLVGNAFSFIVFSSKELRCSSSNVYLLLLSISDSLYLLAVFFSKLLTPLRCWYYADGGGGGGGIALDVASRHQIPCKLFQYLSDLFADFSTCLILAFTVERCIAVFLPIVYRKFCSPKRALTVSTITLGVQAVAIAPYHLLYVDVYNDYKTCGVRSEDDFIFTYFYIAECLLFRVTPVLAITILNIFIGSRVVKVSVQE